MTEKNSGAPGEIRTPDRPVRSRVLYPTELRARRRSELSRYYSNVSTQSEEGPLFNPLLPH